MIMSNYEMSVVYHRSFLHCNGCSFELSTASKNETWKSGDSFIYVPTNEHQIILQLYAGFFLFVTQHHRQGIIDFLLICYDDVAFNLPDFLSDMR